MSGRIAAAFATARAAGRAAFIPYLTAGDPDLATTRRLVEAMVRGGADIVELGVPFSDPIADGPVNQRAAERALRPAVLWRKGCFGSRSAEGCRFVERLLSVRATCQQQ